MNKYPHTLSEILEEILEISGWNRRTLACPSMDPWRGRHLERIGKLANDLEKR